MICTGLKAANSIAGMCGRHISYKPCFHISHISCLSQSAALISSCYRSQIYYIYEFHKMSSLKKKAICQIWQIHTSDQIDCNFCPPMLDIAIISVVQPFLSQAGVFQPSGREILSRPDKCRLKYYSVCDKTTIFHGLPN